MRQGTRNQELGTSERRVKVDDAPQDLQLLSTFYFLLSGNGVAT
jgi:hypothetical protein